MLFVSCLHQLYKLSMRFGNVNHLYYYYGIGVGCAVDFSMFLVN